MTVDIEDGAYVYAGDVLGKSTRTSIKQGDITGGLPRVQDLFEARSPKDKAVVSFISGRVSIGELTKNGRIIYVRPIEGDEGKYIIPLGRRIIVQQGDVVEYGDALSDGALDPHDILVARGIKAAQLLILNEIQEVYRKQGIKIDDKHISIIIRQMFRKVRIINPGHTNFLDGEVVEKDVVLRVNNEVENTEFKDREGNIIKGEGATYDQMLLGITKASLMTESWLSAASFQETTKVLTEASIGGKVDRLEGLKESIILGHKIPVGTGTRHYNDMVEKEVSAGRTMKAIIEKFAHGIEFAPEEEDLEAMMDY
jgi:DNA-directed RNA polymerase subunit beta'